MQRLQNCLDIITGWYSILVQKAVQGKGVSGGYIRCDMPVDNNPVGSIKQKLVVVIHNGKETG